MTHALTPRAAATEKDRLQSTEPLFPTTAKWSPYQTRRIWKILVGSAIPPLHNPLFRVKTREKIERNILISSWENLKPLRVKGRIDWPNENASIDDLHACSSTTKERHSTYSIQCPKTVQLSTLTNWNKCPGYAQQLPIPVKVWATAQASTRTNLGPISLD